METRNEKVLQETEYKDVLVQVVEFNEYSSSVYSSAVLGGSSEFKRTKAYKVNDEYPLCYTLKEVQDKVYSVKYEQALSNIIGLSILKQDLTVYK